MLAQNYQDSILFWAVQLIESDSLRRVNKIVPFQFMSRPQNSTPAFDVLPAIVDATYLCRDMQLGCISPPAASAPGPRLDIHNPFTVAIIGALATQASASVTHSRDFLYNVLTSRVAWNPNAVGPSTYAVSVSGYIIHYTT
jgi:hypothetical protein